MDSLRHRRRDWGLTQGQVAERAGISRSFYTQIENGDRAPSLRVAARLAAVMGLSIDHLLDVLGGVPSEDVPTDRPRRCPGEDAPLRSEQSGGPVQPAAEPETR